MSTPTALRPNFWAARQVVAVPENGSRMVAGMVGALCLQVGSHLSPQSVRLISIFLWSMTLAHWLPHSEQHPRSEVLAWMHSRGRSDGKVAKWEPPYGSGLMSFQTLRRLLNPSGSLASIMLVNGPCDKLFSLTASPSA